LLIIFRTLLFILLFFFPFLIIAQGVAPEELSVGQRIDQSFQPIADSWEQLVFTTITIGGYSIPLVLILLIAGASFFTLYFGFPGLSKFSMAINTVRGKYDALEHEGEEVNIEDIPNTIRDESKKGEVTHFQALATAVSGTVGLGNIAGVAIAIAIGGPGATFWMIICGILGMSSKFVECTLGVKYRDIEADGTVHGGPMYYISKGFKELNKAKFGKFLGGFFAVLCVGASFGGGNAFQSNQAASQLSNLLGVNFQTAGFWIGLGMAFLVAIVIIGGIKRIATITEKIVPFMAALYVLSSLVIIGTHLEYLDDAFILIFEGAFSPSAGLGGMMGVIIVGFQRAAFSNEAGMGSASIAHAAVRTKFPASEGVVALLEPFIDTVVICTMTALVIIFFNIDGSLQNTESIFRYGGDGAGNVILFDGSSSVGGVELTTLAYDAEIPNFSYALTVGIILFAFSTMLSWSYYGLQSWKYLFGKSKAADLTYKFLFLFFIVVGASTTLNAVVKFSDAMILALVFPNMVGLFFLFPKVKEELKKYTDAIKEQGRIKKNQSV
jgi:AGCS family alanine or glycine:cation symporter